MKCFVMECLLLLSAINKAVKRRNKALISRGKEGREKEWEKERERENPMNKTMQSLRHWLINLVLNHFLLDISSSTPVAYLIFLFGFSWAIKKLIIEIGKKCFPFPFHHQRETEVFILKKIKKQQGGNIQTAPFSAYFYYMVQTLGVETFSFPFATPFVSWTWKRGRGVKKWIFNREIKLIFTRKISQIKFYFSFLSPYFFFFFGLSPENFF